ncbi:MAG: hypothetical protein IKG00_03465 [Lachnospiraceae bacterium]|nr:hypothetical protein [Lachnospiraceae bacterium]
MNPYVKLPSMNWFKYGKIFTGSLGTDPLRGCLSCTTFHYRVQMISVGEVDELVAVCFFRLPWNAKTNMFEFKTGIFEATEFGIEIAENWILSQYFIPNEKKEPKMLTETKLIAEKQA